MSKKECFNYIKGNQPDEFYTVHIPHGDPRRNIAHGGGDTSCASIPFSWTVIMTPITGTYGDYFLSVNEKLEPTRSFTSRRSCVKWFAKKTPWEIFAVALPLGDPRRTINNKGRYNALLRGSRLPRILIPWRRGSWKLQLLRSHSGHPHPLRVCKSVQMREIPTWFAIRLARLANISSWSSGIQQFSPVRPFDSTPAFSEGCVPPASCTVTVNPEDTIYYYEQEGVRLIDTTKFMKYLRTQSPKERAAMLASRKSS